jgi:HEAT repeat protein
MEEYVFQSLNATNAVDRLQAIRELQWYSNSDLAVRILMNLAIDDRFSGVREEAVWALGNIRSDSVIKTLILAYGDRESRVRMAAAGSFGRFKGPEVIKTLQHAFEKDSSYYVAAVALQSLVNADSVNKLLYLEKALQMVSYNEIIRTTALRILSLMHNDYAYDILVKHTIADIHPDVRIHAMNLLASSWKERDDVLYLIVRLAKDKNKSVRVSAVRLLGDLGDKRVVKNLKQYAERENEQRVLEELKNVINKLEKSGKDDE